MRILHVGWGFSPWRPGGLILYAEDLMAAQVARGHDVTYLFSGRHYPLVRGPRLRRWRRGGVAMAEIVNSPVVVALERGTRNPERELEEPRLERIFERIASEERPDVIHVQELLGHPSSILDAAAAAGVPVVMTLQDYFPLCATIRLWDADGRVCLRRDVGEDCARGSAAAPHDADHLVRHTLHFELAQAKARLPGLGRVSFAPLRGVVEPALRALSGGTSAAPGAAPAGDPRAFQRRREVNVDRLGRVTRLVAQSNRVAEIYRQLGVNGNRLQTLHLTLAHLEHLTPRPPRAPRQLTFATLAGFVSPAKGSELLLEALARLHDAGLGGRFRLLALGPVHESAVPRLASYPEVEPAGPYERGELDRLLADADVGLMPSVWEEAYGYAGLELLAKGIPVIANGIGGMVDYVREGETGWLNHDLSATGMATIMQRLIEHPEEVAAMSHRVLASRDELIKPFDAHVDEMEQVYREALGNLAPP